MSLLRHGVRVGICLVLLSVISIAPVSADDLWVAPTNQQDVGGLGIGSSGIWPASAIGVSRFAWGVPGSLQTFQGAKVVLIPHAPGGAATLNVFICAAESGDAVLGACAGPFAHAFTGIVNQLLEVDISADVAPRVGAGGVNHLAVVAYTTPTTTTDHIVGLRFAYSPTPPDPNTIGTAQVINDSLTASDLAPGAVAASELAANSVDTSKVAFSFAGSATKGGPAADLACAGCVEASEVTFTFATLGANIFSGPQTAPSFFGSGAGLTNVAKLGINTFTGTQTINGGNLDLDLATGKVTKDGVAFLHSTGPRNA